MKIIVREDEMQRTTELIGLRPHIIQYRKLGADAGERHQTYRELCRNPLEPDVFNAIGAALNEERALGDDQFRQQIEIAQQRRLSLAEAGQLFKKGGSYALPQQPPVSRDANK